MKLREPRLRRWKRLIPRPEGAPFQRGNATEAANASSEVPAFAGIAAGWDEHDVEPPKRCEQAQGTAARRGVNGAEATERHEPCSDAEW